jgi:hypothetical protein
VGTRILTSLHLEKTSIFTFNLRLRQIPWTLDPLFLLYNSMVCYIPHAVDATFDKTDDILRVL